MTTIFNFYDYKEYVHQTVKLMPKRGRGHFGKMAIQLGTSSVTMSQIFRGERHLTLEQALDLAHFWGMNSLEQEYFFLMINYARAGTQKLKSVFMGQLKELQSKALKLKDRLSQDRKLDEAARSIFYSNWVYSGVRLSTSIDKLNTVESLAQNFQIPINEMKKITDFLLKCGLCINKNGLLEMGPQRTHLEADSPHVIRHHQNWRLKGFQKMEKNMSTDLFYTGPMALSKSAFKKIQLEIIQLLESARKHAVDSKSETLACLNVDIFEV